MSGWQPTPRGPYVERGPSRVSAWRQAVTWSVGFVTLLWVVEGFDSLMGNRLDAEGIRPGSTDGLSGVLFAPLLQPTLDTGVSALVAAALSVLDRP